MSSLSQFSSGGKIKSIQRGVITIPTNGTGTSSVTITAVDTSKSIVHLLGFGGRSVLDVSLPLLSYLVLTNSTTITAAGGYPTTNGNSAQISWQLVEYE